MILLTNVSCSGEEGGLANCSTTYPRANSCTHARDVGVRCQIGKYVNCEC